LPLLPASLLSPASRAYLPKILPDAPVRKYLDTGHAGTDPQVSCDLILVLNTCHTQ